MILKRPSSILLGTIFFFLILSPDITPLSSQAQDVNPYAMSTYEWGVEVGDVLSYEIQLSMDYQDLIKESGFRGPLVILSRVDRVPQGPEYNNGDTTITSNPDFSIIEYRLGNSRFSPELFSERFPLLFEVFSRGGFFVVWPINVVDYLTSLIPSGYTDKIEEGGDGEESYHVYMLAVEYTGSYFRVTQEDSYPNLDTFSSVSFELSRYNGIAEEVIIIQRATLEQFTDFAIQTEDNRIYTFESRINFFKIEKRGYQHMGTPGFIFFMGAISLSTYVLLHKQKRFSKTELI
ncbi:MAG: hypothetical protein ACE5OZ_04780 [Candidatus Heimdallarchaeota archaeon]